MSHSDCERLEKYDCSTGRHWPPAVTRPAKCFYQDTAYHHHYTYAIAIFFIWLPCHSWA